MHPRSVPPTDFGGDTTRRGFLKKCGAVAIAVAGATSVLGPARAAFGEDLVWSDIPPQDWAVGIPVYLDLADYCSPDPSKYTFELDPPLPTGVTLSGSIISGTPAEALPETHFVAIASDNVTGVGEASSPGVRASLAASPNPASGPVRFLGRRPSTLGTSGTLRIFAASGRLVYQRAVTVVGDRYEIAWDGRGVGGRKLPSGVYMALMQAGSERARTRFVIAE
jgi:hypothetical protein